MRRMLRTSAQSTMALDCSEHETFVIDMDQSIDRLSVRDASPGKLYVVVIVQDEEGNHTVAWDNRIRNSVAVNLEAESITVQTFVGRAGGLEAITPGTWVRTTGEPGPPGPQGPPGPAGPQGPAGPPAEIIEVADEQTALDMSSNDPDNFYFWVE